MRIVILALSLILCAPRAGADCVDVDFTKPRACTIAEFGCFYSPSTKSDVHYSVTFPSGYAGAESDWPYAIFLHGRGANEHQWTDLDGDKSLNDYVQRGGLPFLVVAPAEPRHSYWKNGPKDEFGTLDMLTTDLVQHLAEKRPLASAAKSGRSIMGLSMGGHGAFYALLKRPDLFATEYSISPVFREEADLLPEDRPAFGSGVDFAAQDPVAIVSQRRKAGQLSIPSDCFRMEIGQQDPFLDGGRSQTAHFLASLQAEYGSEVIDLGRAGAHDAEYWRPALQRAILFVGTNFPAVPGAALRCVRPHEFSMEPARVWLQGLFRLSATCNASGMVSR